MLYTESSCYDPQSFGIWTWKTQLAPPSERWRNWHSRCPCSRMRACVAGVQSIRHISSATKHQSPPSLRRARSIATCWWTRAEPRFEKCYIYRLYIYNFISPMTNAGDLTGLIGIPYYDGILMLGKWANVYTRYDQKRVLLSKWILRM